jgi:hypothetical protein
MKVDIGPYTDDGERSVTVLIHDYDTWSLDHSLGLVALPMLKQLKKTKHGSPLVDLEDCPPHLAFEGKATHEHNQLDLFASEEHDNLVWENMHAKWDWVLDEMIFAFEHICGDNEDWDSGLWKIDVDEWPRPRLRITTGDRIQNGLRLFGKYYRGLWD